LPTLPLPSSKLSSAIGVVEASDIEAFNGSNGKSGQEYVIQIVRGFNQMFESRTLLT
jgi:hypothetical protein